MAIGVPSPTGMKAALLLIMLGGSLFAQLTEPAGKYEPITAKERVAWFAQSTVGPASLLGGTISAGFGTLINRPPEYGTHWDGFGDRYGMRLTGIATGNAIEASVGALWGEDPRYPRKGAEFGSATRIGHIIKWTFVDYHNDGTVHPAYARYIGDVGNNFLSNTWRQPGEADSTHAFERILTGLMDKMAGNAWDEFWPDAKKKFRHHQ
jgi:hypothetical protein